MKRATPNKRIDSRGAGFLRLTWQQQSRWCHLADLFHVDDCPGDDSRAETEADYTERRAWQAQQNANADAAARYGR